MRPRSSWLPLGGLALVLAAALASLYMTSKAGDASGYFEAVAQLRQIKQLDATWELDAMRSKIGLNQSYDPLVSPLAELGTLPRHLSPAALAASDAGAQLGSSLRAFQLALNQKAALIESFKSHNAVLKNSQAFLPAAAGDILGLAEQQGQAGQAAHARLERLRSAVGTTLLATPALENGSQREPPDIENKLADLIADAALLPATVSDSVTLFAAHVRTVLREHQLVQDLLARIAAAPTGRHLDEIDVLLSGEQQIQALRTQRHRLYLLLLSAALAGLLLYAAVSLIRSQLTINRVNQQLLLANGGLEAAVLERTGELLCANALLQTQIAERKQLEGRLLQSEKLASIGQLAAGVAHEINNPLGFVASNADMLEQYVERLLEMLASYEEAELEMAASGGLAALAARLCRQRARLELDYLKQDIPVMIAESRDGMERVGRIVQSLKEFARTDAQQQWELADLHRCIDSTLNIIASEVRKVADVRKEYGALPDVECMPSQLNQVVMNLLINAAHAMGTQRGRITIRTGVEGAQGWIEVADTGSGIAPEVLPRIFDPFFTTKGIGKGTGLGLSLSYGIVQNHGGSIDVRSVPGSGTTFRIMLPLRRSAATVPDDCGIFGVSA